MTNADKFKDTFMIYAAELWAKSESEFLDWLNAEYSPSAELEIIRCKDCTSCEIDPVFGEYWCNGRKVQRDHYCGYAERRTDE